jgi:hypothetical protein
MELLESTPDAWSILSHLDAWQYGFHVGWHELIHLDMLRPFVQQMMGVQAQRFELMLLRRHCVGVGRHWHYSASLQSVHCQGNCAAYHEQLQGQMELRYGVRVQVQGQAQLQRHSVQLQQHSLVQQLTVVLRHSHPMVPLVLH